MRVSYPDIRSDPVQKETSVLVPSFRIFVLCGKKEGRTIKHAAAKRSTRQKLFIFL